MFRKQFWVQLVKATNTKKTIKTYWISLIICQSVTSSFIREKVVCNTKQAFLVDLSPVCNKSSLFANSAK